MKKLLLLTVCFLCCNTLISQPRVLVYGNDTSDSLQTTRQVYHCLELLEVDEDICICIRFSEVMPRGVQGTTFFQNTISGGAHGGMLPIYRVRISARLRGSQRLIALAHEMVHLKQYVKKELRDTKNNGFLWKGKAYKHLVASDRLVSPWEQEAYGLDNQLADMVQKGCEAFLLAQQQEPDALNKSAELHVFKNKSTNP